MVMPCKICKHSDRQAIDAVLLEGWPSLRVIGTQYGVSKDSLLRHYRAHIPDAAAASDDSQGNEEPDRPSLAVTEKEPDEARQAAEDSTEKKEPTPPRLWTAEQWEEFGRQIEELGRLIRES